MENKKQLINTTLYELNLLIDIMNKQGSLSEIEKDILLGKLRLIYENASKLETTGIEKKVPETKMPEKGPEEIKEEYIVKEKKVEPDIIKDGPKENTIENKEKGPVQERTISKTVGDKYQGSTKYMDEQLSQQHQTKDITAKMQNKPIEDLAKAIGLNDKFLFINELFKGDSSQFKNTIEKLNNSANFNEAFSYLNDNLSWDMKNETVQKLLELIRRKFITSNK